MRIGIAMIVAGTTALGVWTGAHAKDGRSAGLDTASTWFTCARGGMLEVLGTDARCTFPPIVTLEPLAACAAGWTGLTDYQGAQIDMCREDGGRNQVSARRCPPPSLKVIQAGPDRCERVFVKDPEPPSVAAQA